MYLLKIKCDGELFTNGGEINGKAGKAAALPKFSNMLTLSQPG